MEDRFGEGCPALHWDSWGMDVFCWNKNAQLQGLFQDHRRNDFWAAAKSQADWSTIRTNVTIPWIWLPADNSSTQMFLQVPHHTRSQVFTSGGNLTRLVIMYWSNKTKQKKSDIKCLSGDARVGNDDRRCIFGTLLCFSWMEPISALMFIPHLFFLPSLPSYDKITFTNKPSAQIAGFI